MNYPASPLDWWEGLSRCDLQARAKREEPRMSASKIGQWRQINAEWEFTKRTKQGPAVNEQGDEQ